MPKRIMTKEEDKLKMRSNGTPADRLTVELPTYLSDLPIYLTKLIPIGSQLDRPTLSNYRPSNATK